MNCTLCKKQFNKRDEEVKEIISVETLNECRSCYMDILSIKDLKQFNDLSRTFYENKEKNIFNSIDSTKIKTNH